ncbi:cell wall anchor protein [Cordyceps fumosorosea ARSEF 2679]|uniref:Cell wall anchor protein n=1 Tax=Cordyceps fumosorosea (strain ARSEF 2679) TaxID=1081104 RepID=A0A167M3N2_CORFA|nr:cell wall anchor protein [Cordyceps fumosorosea ARSEF 2679]OAA53881.1 cell wall anchor protein [Cordyceps fumosorosea ARSEF 2679]
MTGTSHAIGNATPGRRSAGQGKSQGSSGPFSGRPGRVRGQSVGSLTRVSALETSPPALSQRHHSIRDSTETAEATQNVTEKQAPNPNTSTTTGTGVAAAGRLATKTRLPVSSTAVSSSTDLQCLSPSSPLLHRQPRTYLRTRASSSLAAPALERASSRPPSQASAVATPLAARRPRRPSDDSAISLDDHSSSPPPGSSPPSSVGRDLQASSPFAEPKSAFSSSPPRTHHHRHRHRASSFDLPSAVRPRPRAYSDQGPRPDVSRPPQTFFLRRSSNPELPVGPDSRLSTSSSHSSLLSRSSREPASFSAKGISTSSGPPPSINVRLLDSAAHDASFAALHQHHQQHYQHYQPRLITASRQLLPLKTAARSSTPDEHRRRSLQRSYRLSLTGSLPANTSPTRVAPIRSFRSSGSRKSLHSPDMNFTPRPYDLSESAGAPLYDEDPANATTASPYDRQSRLMTPPVSGRQVANGEESGDVFLRLAREDAVNRGANARTPDGTYSPVSATHRSWHRRPLSTNLTSHQQLSPPKLRRRLSDQQERPFLGNLEDDQTSQASRVLQYRSMGRDKAASAHPGEMASQYTPSPRTHRPPPVSSRSPVYHDNSDNYRHTRRRSSVTESTPPLSSRGQHKAGAVHNFSKMYNSSPLVRSFDLTPPQPHEPQNGVEGTESTGSTTAPSTVWDELDELKSRINRLEITGKIPATSGATVSKLDERPVTAGTTVTTASISPKRQVNVHTDDTASVSTPTNVYPLLQTALANCKLNLSSQVYQALDCLAQDALGLSATMGQGPIPSGASTVGSGSAATDRQLRRKAESVCRSLTELCITLNDDAGHRASTSQYQAQAFAPGTPLTPTIPKSHSSGLPVVRRASIVDGNMSHTSPRVLSKFEERRNSLLHGSGPPVSLHSTPNNLMSNDGRHSSLFVSRTRQIRQEDPEDGRESVLSRTRRAMTEEPEDGRRSTFLVRSRRGTAEDMDQPLSRSPTRRTVTMAYQPTNEHAIETDTPDRYETSSVVSSAAPRRRFIPELHTSRLAGPAGSSPAPTRKYLERTVSTREGAGTPTMERLSRHVSLHSRTGSQSRTNRDSMLPRPPNGNATPEGPQ